MIARTCARIAKLSTIAALLAICNGCSDKAQHRSAAPDSFVVIDGDTVPLTAVPDTLSDKTWDALRDSGRAEREARAESAWTHQ